MDATPVTLGQEFGGYAAQVALRRRAARGDAAAGARAAPRRHRGRHRHQHARRASPPQVDRASSPTTTGLPFTEAREPLRGPGRPGRARRAVRAAAHDRRGRPHQDLQRPALDGLRARAPGSAEIHLPDLQPGSSIMPGKVNPVLPEATLMVVRAGHRQRRRDRLRRRVGQLRAQRDAAGDRPQPARVDPAARQRLAGCSPTAASTASPPTSSGCRALRRVLAVDRHAAEPLPRLRGRRRRSPSRRSPSGATIREVVLDAGLRRARRAHRGAARRGPRRRCVDDPPLTGQGLAAASRSSTSRGPAMAPGAARGAVARRWM